MFAVASLLPNWFLSVALLTLANQYRAEGSTIVTATGMSVLYNSTGTTSVHSDTATSSQYASEVLTPGEQSSWNTCL